MNIPNSSWIVPDMHSVFYSRNMCSSSSSIGSRSVPTTHYETLHLKRDCTAKEIRTAFLKLSKEFHPDKNLSNPNNHAEFVKLNEAYSVLSKPHSRTNYDLSLWNPHKPIDPSQNGPFQDPNLWTNRDRSKDKYYEDRSYYGIKGVKKLPNSWIVAFCLVFTVFGVGIQALAITKSVTFERDKLDEYSMRNSRLLSKARQQARENGNEVQLELLRQRLNDPKYSGHTVQNVSNDDAPKEGS